MFKYFVSLSILFFINSAYADFIQSSQKFTELLQKLQKENIFAGVSVVVLDNKNHKWSGHFGYRDVENKIVADDHTVYELASNSKTFTRLLLALQTDMDLKDPISKYLPPNVHAPIVFGEEIKLQDLALHTAQLNSVPCLTNTTGVHCYGLNSSDLITDPYKNVDKKSLFQFLNDYQTMIDAYPNYFTHFGMHYAYSNAGVALLGDLLALHNNTSYEQLLQKKILIPLDMQETLIEMSCELSQSCKNLAKVYRKNSEQQWVERSIWHMQGIAGAGGIRSTLSDMTKYLQFQMGINTNSSLEAALKNSQTEIPDATEKLKSNLCTADTKSLTCNTNVDRQFEGWPYDSIVKAFYHAGMSGASQSMVLFTPEHDFGIVILMNSINVSTDVVTPMRNLANDLAICAQQVFGAYAGPAFDFCARLN